MSLKFIVYWFTLKLGYGAITLGNIFTEIHIVFEMFQDCRKHLGSRNISANENDFNNYTR